MSCHRGAKVPRRLRCAVLEAYLLPWIVVAAVDLSHLQRLLAQGEFQSALIGADEAIVTAEDVVERADLHRIGVQAAFRLGDVATARTHALEQLSCALRAADPGLEGRAHNDLAVLDGFEGHEDAALERLWKASEAFRRSSDGPSPAVLNNLGNLYVRMGRYDEAIGHFHRAVEGFRAVSNLANVAVSLANVGRSEALAGRAGLAIQPLDEALAIFERLGRPDDVVTTLAKLGLAHGKDGAFEHARSCFERAMDGHAQGLAAPFAGDTRLWFAEFLFDRGEDDRVVELLGPLRTGGGDVRPVDPVHDFDTIPMELLAHALARLGRHDEAFAALSRLYRAVQLHARDRHVGRLQETMTRRSDHASAVRAPLQREPTEPPTVPFDERIVELERMVVGLRARAERMERAAHTDALTGLKNRRGFERAYAVSLAEARRTDGDLTLALVDLDEFKGVNDAYGHDVGDKVLAQVASILTRATSVDDVVARWGGEEFAVALPGTSLEQAAATLDAMRQQVERHPWSRLAPGLHVTCSIGAVSWHESTTADPPLTVADRRLYDAKRAGRNTVVASDQAS